MTHCDIELLLWLINLDEPWVSQGATAPVLRTEELQNTLLEQEALVLEDEDGWGLAGMMIQSSCGRQEMEEGVRAIVSKWGLESGPREGRDRSECSPYFVQDHAEATR